MNNDETALWILVVEVAILIAGLYYAAQKVSSAATQAQASLASNPFANLLGVGTPQ